MQQFKEAWSAERGFIFLADVAVPSSSVGDGRDTRMFSTEIPVTSCGDVGSVSPVFENVEMQSSISVSFLANTKMSRLGSEAQQRVPTGTLAKNSTSSGVSEPDILS